MYQIKLALLFNSLNIFNQLEDKHGSYATDQPDLQHSIGKLIWTGAVAKEQKLQEILSEYSNVSGLAQVNYSERAITGTFYDFTVPEFVEEFSFLVSPYDISILHSSTVVPLDFEELPLDFARKAVQGCKPGTHLCTNPTTGYKYCIKDGYTCASDKPAKKVRAAKVEKQVKAKPTAEQAQVISELINRGKASKAKQSKAKYQVGQEASAGKEGKARKVEGGYSTARKAARDLQQPRSVKEKESQELIAKAMSNPFLGKITAKQQELENLHQKLFGDTRMRDSFILGAGNPGNASSRSKKAKSEKAVEKTIDQSVQATKLTKEIETLHAQAKAYSAGKIDEQGQPISKDHDKRQAQKQSREDRIQAAQDAVAGKQPYEVTSDQYADAQGTLAGAGRDLHKYGHSQIVKQAHEKGKTIPEHVLAEYPELQTSTKELLDNQDVSGQDSETSKVKGNMSTATKTAEPHELTLDEYKKSIGVDPELVRDSTALNAESAHREHILKALDDGKAVAEHVINSHTSINPKPAYAMSEKEFANRRMYTAGLKNSDFPADSEAVKQAKKKLDIQEKALRDAKLGHFVDSPNVATGVKNQKQQKLVDNYKAASREYNAVSAEARQSQQKQGRLNAIIRAITEGKQVPEANRKEVGAATKEIEPYEQTLQQYADSQAKTALKTAQSDLAKPDLNYDDRKVLVKKVSKLEDLIANGAYQDEGYQKEHKKAVLEAIAAGKPVPTQVREDYRPAKSEQSDSKNNIVGINDKLTGASPKDIVGDIQHSLDLKWKPTRTQAEIFFRHDDAAFRRDGFKDGRPKDIETKLAKLYPDLVSSAKVVQEGDNKPKLHLVKPEQALLGVTAKKPFGNVSVENEDDFYGSEITVKMPQVGNHVEPDQKGKVIRVWNGGSLIEYHPEGFDRDATFRIAGDAVTIDKLVQKESKEKSADKQQVVEPKKPYIGVGDLAETYRAQGLDKQRAFGQYIKDTKLLPIVKSEDVDAKDFYKAYDAAQYPKVHKAYPVKNLAKAEQSPAESTLQKARQDTIAKYGAAQYEKLTKAEFLDKISSIKHTFSSDDMRSLSPEQVKVLTRSNSLAEEHKLDLAAKLQGGKLLLINHSGRNVGEVAKDGKVTNLPASEYKHFEEIPAPQPKQVAKTAKAKPSVEYFQERKSEHAVPQAFEHDGKTITYKPTFKREGTKIYSVSSFDGHETELKGSAKKNVLYDINRHNYSVSNNKPKAYTELTKEEQEKRHYKEYQALNE